MLRLVLVFFLAPAALAQDGAHVLPYPTAASEPHVVELALGGADGEALRVHVGASPAWLVFSSPSVASEQSADGERAGRLAFTVAADAPVGEEGAVALVVTDAVGAERARHTVWLTVAAPELALAAPWPNPSRGAATVAFMLPEAGPVRLSVLDVLSREVAVLADGDRAAGRHEVRVPRGALAAGTYAVRLVTEGAARVTRLTVLR